MMDFALILKAMEIPSNLQMLNYIHAKRKTLGILTSCSQRIQLKVFQTLQVNVFKPKLPLVGQALMLLNVEINVSKDSVGIQMVP